MTGGLATAGIYHQAPVAEVSRGLVAASVIALGALLAPVITIGGRGKGLGDPESTNQPGRAEPGLDQATPDQASGGAAMSRLIVDTDYSVLNNRSVNNTTRGRTMNTQTHPAGSVVRILADHRADKRLGNWTTSRDFEIRSRHGRVVLDLRSPQIPDGDIQIDLDLDRSAVTLLVAEDAVIDQWELAWTGGGKVKQTFHHPAARPGRMIRLTGHIRRGEVRVHSGGIAQLSAICSREFLADARRAHADGRLPTLDDPTRGA